MKNKAQWHKDLNGGVLPVLELIDGTTLYESRVIMDLAHDYARDQGFELYSKDPVKAAQ